MEPHFCHKVLCVSYDVMDHLFKYALLTDLTLEWLWFFIVGSNRINSGFEVIKTVLKIEDRNMIVINSVGF